MMINNGDEMITPFQVYLVMQLDVFSTTIFLLCMWSFVLLGLTALMGIDIQDSEYDNEKRKIEKLQKRVIWKKYLKAELFFLIFFSVFYSVIPSSKTAAAMFILPAITSDKVINAVTPELKELYSLTKEALKNLSKEAK